MAGPQGPPLVLGPGLSPSSDQLQASGMGVDPIARAWRPMGKNDSFSPPDGSVQDFLGPILAVDRVLQDLYQILYAIQDVEDSLQDINVPGHRPPYPTPV